MLEHLALERSQAMLFLQNSLIERQVSYLYFLFSAKQIVFIARLGLSFCLSVSHRDYLK